MESNDISSLEDPGNIPIGDDEPKFLANGDSSTDTELSAVQLDPKMREGCGSPGHELTVCEIEFPQSDCGANEPDLTNDASMKGEYSAISGNFEATSGYCDDISHSLNGSQGSLKGDFQLSEGQTTPQTEDGVVIVSALKSLHDPEVIPSYECKNDLCQDEHNQPISAASGGSDSESTGKVGESREKEPNCDIPEESIGKALHHENLNSENELFETGHITEEVDASVSEEEISNLDSEEKKVGPEATVEAEFEESTKSCFGPSNESKNSVEIKNLQMGIEEELNLEEIAVSLESLLQGEMQSVTDILPSITVEERPPARAANHKVYSQTHEVTEPTSPTSIENFPCETLDYEQGKAAHQVAELQRVEVQIIPVEFSDSEPNENKYRIGEIKQDSTMSVELVEPKSSETLGSVFRVELERGQLVEASLSLAAKQNGAEINRSAEEIQIISIENSLMEKSQSPLGGDASQGSGDEKENVSPSEGESKINNAPQGSERDLTTVEGGPFISQEELDFDTRYALFVGKILPGHEIYYMPAANAKKKQVTFRRGGTLDQRRTVSGNSPLWDAQVNMLRIKSATLEAPRSHRRRLQPKPGINDDHLFPDSVTPSKVEKNLNENDTRMKDENRYDVPFMDDDAFVPKKYRSVVVADDDSSTDDGSDYSDERNRLIEAEHLAKMDETPHLGLTAIEGKRDINQVSGSRWGFGLSICGCLRRRR